MYQFGAGPAYGVPIGGNTATNPTPQWFGTLQSVDFEVDAQLVSLKGQFQFPDDVAIGDKSIKGKLMFGRIETALMNQLMFGDASSSGLTGIQPRESHSIPTTPYQVTIAPPNSGTFSADLGVIFTATGVALTKVASGPTTGQYSVSAGVYTFAAADTTLGVLISYTYTTTTGAKQQIGNQNMGDGPTCELWLATPYQDTRNGLHLPAVKFGKLSAPMKRDGYMIQTLDYEAFASPTLVTTNGQPLVAEFFQISA